MTYPTKLHVRIPGEFTIDERPYWGWVYWSKHRKAYSAPALEGVMYSYEECKEYENLSA